MGCTASQLTFVTFACGARPMATLAFSSNSQMRDVRLVIVKPDILEIGSTTLENTVLLR